MPPTIKALSFTPPIPSYGHALINIIHKEIADRFYEEMLKQVCLTGSVLINHNVTEPPKIVGNYWVKFDKPASRSAIECELTGGVRPGDRGGMAKAEREKVKPVAVSEPAPVEKPSAGLLTMAVQTHRFGGWGA
jgi:hypothetical protein